MKKRPDIEIPESEYELAAVRASGPGGQHVNKVSTAVLLRFDIRKSSLPDWLKEKLLNTPDRRLTEGGEILIRSGKYRSQKRNREAVIALLHDWVQKGAQPAKKRRKTRVPRKAIEARLKKKARRAEIKKMRGKINPD